MFSLSDSGVLKARCTQKMLIDELAKHAARGTLDLTSKLASYAHYTVEELAAELAVDHGPDNCTSVCSRMWDEGSFVRIVSAIDVVDWGIDGPFNPAEIAPLFCNVTSLEFHMRDKSLGSAAALLKFCFKLKVMHVPWCTNSSDSALFFEALRRTPVETLILMGRMHQTVQSDLCGFLVSDKLVKLEMWLNENGHNHIRPELRDALIKTTRLTDLTFLYTTFPDQAAFPTNLITLSLKCCDLKGALSLPAGLESLTIDFCSAAKFTFDAANMRNMKSLDLNMRLTEAGCVQIASLLTRGILESLRIVDSPLVRAVLRPAIAHPGCGLRRIAIGGTGPTAFWGQFHKHSKLFLLLQSRLVRNKRCPLQRLPVELIRLVSGFIL